MKPVAPAVQFVTSKPSALGREFESRCNHTNWVFSSQKKQKKQIKRKKKDKAQEVEND